MQYRLYISRVKAIWIISSINLDMIFHRYSSPTNKLDKALDTVIPQEEKTITNIEDEQIEEPQNPPPLRQRDHYKLDIEGYKRDPISRFSSQPVLPCLDSSVSSRNVYILYTISEESM